MRLKGKKVRSKRREKGDRVWDWMKESGEWESYRNLETDRQIKRLEIWAERRRKVERERGLGVR